MPNQKIKFVNAIILFLNFIFVITTGLLLKFAIPQDSDAAFMYIYRNEWMQMHCIFSLILCVFIILHIILNWEWIVTMFKFNMKSPRDL